MTWTTLPLFVFGSAAGFLGAALVRVAISPRTALSAIGLQLAFQRLRPAHDLCDLLGDLRLPRPVVGALQQLDNLAGVVGRVLHRRALCAEERRRRLHRSEEHTSELQSRFDLVCRLLLEKKKSRSARHSDRSQVSR